MRVEGLAESVCVRDLQGSRGLGFLKECLFNVFLGPWAVGIRVQDRESKQEDEEEEEQTRNVLDLFLPFRSTLHRTLNPV